MIARSSNRLRRSRAVARPCLEPLEGRRLLAAPTPAGAVGALVAPDTTGPRVAWSSPTGTGSGRLSYFQLNFSEPIRAGSLTAADVALIGPGGPIAATGVRQASATQYYVDFAPQAAAGVYSLTVGPGVADLAGNAMDQDRDGTDGGPGDRYTATATLAAMPPRFDFGTGSSPVASGYAGADPSTWYTAFRGYGWNSFVSGIDTGTGAALTRDFDSASDGSFYVDLPDGTYDVTPTMGDATAAHGGISLWLEGRRVATGLTTQAGQYLRPTYRVQVTDGQLNLRLAGTDGTSSFALDGLEISPVTTDVTAPGATGVMIDPSWLARRGAGPYMLDQAGTTYTLATDVDTPGTAFVVAAPGVTLDLNGHTVTYGDSTPTAVANGGFEQGSGRSVPGWNLSGAPAATIAPNTNYLFGSQVLRFAPFATPQRIISDPVAIYQANHTYAATITPAQGTPGMTVKLSVVDAVTGRVLASGTSADPGRGFSATVRFTPTTTDPLRLQVDLTPPAGKAASVDLDAATLTVADDYGILTSGAWSGQVPGYANLPPAAQSAYRKAADVTIRGGAIRQGLAGGYASSPIYAQQINGLTVDGVQTFATGMDTEDLMAAYATGSLTLRNSTLQDDIANISNRTHLNASVNLFNTHANILIDGNRILGSPQVGIQADLNDPKYSFVISNNEIRQKTVVTNGYAIVISALQNFTIANNTIDPDNGRGIDIDGFRSTPTADGRIYGNTVTIKEGPEREYGASGIEARALRLRNNVDAQGPIRDLAIEDNTFAVTCGPGQTSVADAVRISLLNPGGTMNNAGIVFRNNTMRAVADTTDPGYRAAALLVCGTAPGINIQFIGNTLESNDTSLALGGDDGYAVGVSDVLFQSNILGRSTAGPARSYTGIRAGYWYEAIHNARLIDTRATGGATATITWSGSGAKDIATGWLLTVKAVNAASAPLAGAAVTISDSTGAQVYAGTTGADGLAANIPVLTTVYRQPGTSPSAITTANLGPLKVTVTSGSTSVSQILNPTADMALTLTVA